MVDTWLIVAIVAVTLVITGGVKISIENINIHHRRKENDDTE